MASSGTPHGHFHSGSPTCFQPSGTPTSTFRLGATDHDKDARANSNRNRRRLPDFHRDGFRSRRRLEAVARDDPLVRQAGEPVGGSAAGRKRAAGESRFNGWKLWNLAIEAITGFSTVPLRIWSYIGATISLLSFFYGSFIVLKTLIFGVDVPGYASIFAVVLFLGGIQLIGIGILGEYIGRIYLETKSRPLYIVSKNYD